VKTSTQLKALVRNLSRAKNVEAEIILRNFMLERFLERISVSRYKDNFILKGGMLIAAMVGIDTRNTMDMDATVKGQGLTEAQIKEIIEDILNVPMDDHVLFSFCGIEEIREGEDYPGFRVSVDAALDKTRQTMHIDITTGDFVTPREIEYSFRLMFEDRAISILAYNLETVLAEKFETIITRGLANTRMRDIYDIHVLTSAQRFDASVFRAALDKTSAKRKTTGQIALSGAIIERISSSQILRGLWSRYGKNNPYASDVTWETAMESLRNLVGQL
jgi:predicted nucleotidyltransferase component of viral defense system